MFELPDLAYDHAALEPVISKATMHLHHDKHHKRYVDVTNQILDDLVKALQPQWMRIEGDFLIRGGIRTLVVAEHGKKH